MNALRLLSYTVNGCYENAFMSVWSSFVVPNIDVAHSRCWQARFVVSITLVPFFYELPVFKFYIQ